MVVETRCKRPPAFVLSHSPVTRGGRVVHGEVKKYTVVALPAFPSIPPTANARFAVGVGGSIPGPFELVPILTRVLTAEVANSLTLGCPHAPPSNRGDCHSPVRGELQQADPHPRPNEGRRWPEGPPDSAIRQRSAARTRRPPAGVRSCLEAGYQVAIGRSRRDD